MSLRKQGANNGAATSFLISTPESGVDSISISFALLDPIITIARPVSAFFIASFAGIAENIFGYKKDENLSEPDLTCPVDGCCDGINCPPNEHLRHHTFSDKVKAGLGFALTELWDDMAAWFFLGLMLAGLITALIPDEVIGQSLGGGIQSMLIMLAVGIPLYICATASTPIAAALILKGVSPGTALVFLIAGPATNVTSLTVLLGILGKRATTIYLVSIGLLAVVCGLALDRVYGLLGISAQAIIGQAAEIMPVWAEWTGAAILILLSIKPIYRTIKTKLRPEKPVPIQIQDSFQPNHDDDHQR